MKNTIVKVEARDGFLLTMRLIDMELDEKIKKAAPSMQEKWYNGYLTFPKGHKFENVNYDDINISVHGGLTYSDRAEDVIGWTIGFDTAHFSDNIEIQNEEYVWKEIESMYEQAKGLTNEQV